MSEVFDLSNLNDLCNKAHPSAIIVVDTNVVMNRQDFTQWKVSIGEPVFILCDSIVTELERVRRKPDSREAATEAIRKYNGLTQIGDINSGIHVGGAGWFVSVPSPPSDSMKMALSQFEDLIEVFGKSDIKLMILTKESAERFSNVPTVFLTGDVNLANIFSSNGAPAFVFDGLPVLNLEKWIGNWHFNADISAAMTDANEQMRDISVEVESTLTGKRRLPGWITTVDNDNRHTDTVVVAEGHGVIRNLDGKDIGFLWSLPFGFGAETFVIKARLDFMGLDADIPGTLKENLTKRISICADTGAYAEDTPMPTVQDSTTVVYDFFFGEHLLEHKEELNSDSETKLRILQEWEKIVDNPMIFRVHCLKWLLGSESDDDPLEALADRLDDFLDAIDSCWDVGRTVRFRVFMDSAKPPEV